MDWLIKRKPEQPPATFPDVFATELDLIKRRRAAPVPEAARGDAEQTGGVRVRSAEPAPADGPRRPCGRSAEPGLAGEPGGPPANAEAAEPWPADDPNLVGLALSGGGIRSACFNLGLLQALGNKPLPGRPGEPGPVHKPSILSRVDYLSTVSGGGYVGSCLSSLLADELAREEKDPSAPFAFDGEDESPVIKYLRRHGDYLAPRQGLFQLDTWRLASAYLGGLLLSLGTVLLLIAAVASSGVALWRFLFFGWQRLFAEGATTKSALADAARFLREPDAYFGTIVTPTIIVLGLWAAAGFAYVVVKIHRRWWTLGFRRAMEKVRGFLLGSAAALAVAAAIPFLFVAATGMLRSLGATLATAGVVSSLSLTGLARLGERVREAASKVERFRRVAIAAGASILVAVACLGVLYVVWLYQESVLVISVGSLLALLVLAAVGDTNRISMFHFYRDRLSEAFILRRRRPAGRDPRAGAAGGDPQAAAPAEPRGSGGDRHERDYLVENNDDLLLGDLAYDDRRAPYHLINACVNLPSSKVPELRDRKADFFLLSPLFCGSGATGYVPTSRDPKRGRALAWAMAVSGAAANPQLGTRSSPALAFLLAMLNARLGVWAPNPGKRPFRAFGEVRGPLLWPYYLLRELLSEVDEDQPLINLSDGGHIENLGVYELLRRRCRIIVCSDASADPDAAFEDLGNLIRKARIDMGAQIEVDLDEIQGGLKHVVQGTIRYPLKGGGGQKAHWGVFVYVKSALVKDDPQDLHEYHRSHPAFPHETTVDQFFDEAQFESYRELGYRSGKAVAAEWKAEWE